jgi:hypothetical protein
MYYNKPRAKGWRRPNEVRNTIEKPFEANQKKESLNKQ